MLKDSDGHVISKKSKSCTVLVANKADFSPKQWLLPELIQTDAYNVQDTSKRAHRKKEPQDRFRPLSNPPIYPEEEEEDDDDDECSYIPEEDVIDLTSSDESGKDSVKKRKKSTKTDKSLNSDSKRKKKKERSISKEEEKDEKKKKKDDKKFHRISKSKSLRQFPQVRARTNSGSNSGRASLDKTHTLRPKDDSISPRNVKKAFRSNEDSESPRCEKKASNIKNDIISPLAEESLHIKNESVSPRGYKKTLHIKDESISPMDDKKILSKNESKSPRREGKASHNKDESKSPRHERKVLHLKGDDSVSPRDDMFEKREDAIEAINSALDEIEHYKKLIEEKKEFIYKLCTKFELNPADYHAAKKTISNFEDSPGITSVAPIPLHVLAVRSKKIEPPPMMLGKASVSKSPIKKKESRIKEKRPKSTIVYDIEQSVSTPLTTSGMESADASNSSDESFPAKSPLSPRKKIGLHKNADGIPGHKGNCASKKKSEDPVSPVYSPGLWQSSSCVVASSRIPKLALEKISEEQQQEQKSNSKKEKHKHTKSKGKK